jgi:PAS domain S-box-containing protein
LVVLSVVGWVSSISLALSTTDLHKTLPLGRLGFFFATLMPFSLVCLFRTFHRPAPHYNKSPFVIAATLCFLFAALSISPWVVKGAAHGTGRPNFIYGPLHPLLGAYLISCFFFALFTLWRVAREASGMRKLQLRYLGMGVLLGGVGIVTTNLLIPVLWQTSYYSLFGPYFTLVFVSFSAHAIISHRLMDVKVVVRKGVVYVSALGVASLLFLAAAALTRVIGTRTTEHLSLTVAVAIALTVSILFQPLKQWIHNSLNRYLYREPYDYQQTVREATRRLSTILDLKTLLHFLTQVIDRTLRVESVAIYLPAGDSKEYLASIVTSHGVRGSSSPPISLAASSPIVTFLQTQQRPFLLEEPPRNYPHELTQTTIDELQRVGGTIVFPLLDEQSVSGVLVIGPKRSGDPYLIDDVDLISTLVGQAAVAMKNAHLYREVVLANERIENILETMDNGVIAVTADQKVTLFNSAAEGITGLDAKQLKHSSLTLLPLEISEPIRATLRDLQPRLQHETVLLHPPRGSTSIIYSTSPLRDASGTVFGVVAVLNNVTRLRELEAEKRRTERLASIGAFASGIAHEIKNPLVAIKTFAELLPERFTEKEFREDFAEIAIREIERIDELIGRLRGLVTLQPQQFASTSIRELLDDTLALLRGQLEQAKIAVTISPCDDAFAVAGDRSQLKQLVLNIFLNSIEAMQHGGDLVVTLSRVHVEEQDCVELAIQDSGPGIPEAIFGQMFDPFVTTKPQGSGLGLSICRGIVEAHRGSITIHNNAHTSGVTVIIKLPVAQSPPTAAGLADHDSV